MDETVVSSKKTAIQNSLDEVDDCFVCKSIGETRSYGENWKFWVLLR